MSRKTSEIGGIRKVADGIGKQRASGCKKRVRWRISETKAWSVAVSGVLTNIRFVRSAPNAERQITQSIKIPNG